MFTDCIRLLTSRISVIAFFVIPFSIALMPYLTQDAFATHAITAYVANDPNDADTVFSSGDTLTITIPAGNVTTGAISVETDVTGNFTFVENPLGTFTTDWTAEWLALQH